MAVGFVFAGAEGEVASGRAYTGNTQIHGDLRKEMRVNIVGKHLHLNKVVSTTYLDWAV